MKYALIIIVVLAVADLLLVLFAYGWREYKLRYFKRVIWLAFGYCPRCNCKVNWTRNGHAVCPDCGRRC